MSTLDLRPSWVVCDEYAAGPFTAAAAAVNRLDTIARSTDSRTCRLPHTIVTSDVKPVTVADRERQKRAAADAHEPRFWTDANGVPCRAWDI
jgi:hypothetical protein